MSSPHDDLARWRDDMNGGHPLRARAAALADAARDVPPLGAEGVARVRAQVLAETRRGGGVAHVFRGLPVSERLVAVACLVLLSAATAKGTAIIWRRYVAPALRPTGEKASAPSAERTSKTSATHLRAVTAPEAPLPVVPLPAEPLAAAASPSTEASARVIALAAPGYTRSPKPAPEIGAPREATTPPVEPAPPLEVAAAPESESRLLAGALSQLRQAGDPRGALALLDRYADAFPRGVLEPASMRARLEALLQLNDRAAALALLDGRRSFSGRLGAEDQLIRAELRASAGRHADARADFDALLGPAFASAHLSADILERSLYGRAVCLGHLNQDERARADLRLYLQRFPSGKHAREAARLLGDDAPKDPL
jgi:hypothetical protein